MPIDFSSRSSNRRRRFGGARLGDLEDLLVQLHHVDAGARGRGEVVDLHERRVLIVEHEALGDEHEGVRRIHGPQRREQIAERVDGLLAVKGADRRDRVGLVLDRPVAHLDAHAARLQAPSRDRRTRASAPAAGSCRRRAGWPSLRKSRSGRSPSTRSGAGRSSSSTALRSRSRSAVNGTEGAPGPMPTSATRSDGCRRSMKPLTALRMPKNPPNLIFG